FSFTLSRTPPPPLFPYTTLFRSNAITTAPHLHFGIYRSGQGAVDPFPFLQELVLPQQTVLSDSMDIGKLATITTPLANVRQAPTTSSAKITSLEQSSVTQILGKAGSWYRVALPTGQKGYIFDNLLTT